MFLFLMGCGLTQNSIYEDTFSPSIEVQPQQLDYGEIQVGSSKSLTLTLTNLDIENVFIKSITVSENSSFIIESFIELPSKISDEGTTIDLLFAPSQVGSFNGLLSISSSIGSIDVPLKGEGIEKEADMESGDISLSSYSINFGESDVDDSIIKKVAISNIGGKDLLFKDAQTGEAAFSWTVNYALPVVIEQGEWKDIDIVFTPNAEGDFESWIKIESDDPDTPKAQISLSGTSKDTCDICSPLISVSTGGPDDHYLGDFFVLSNYLSDSKPLTIQNVGDEDLTLTRIYINNDTFSIGGAFKVNWSGGPVILFPSESISYTVEYYATSSSWDDPLEYLDQNVLHIKSDDPYEPDYIIGLCGKAL